MRIGLFAIMAILAATASADYVELKNGTRIDGRILAENDDGLEIEVGANEAGTIRRVLIIHSSEIATWAADAEGRIARKEEATVTRLTGTDYVKRLLAEAEKKINDRKFDEGIGEFQAAAEIATRNLDDLEGGEKVEALKIRAHALRLAQAGLEGKLDLIESQTEGVEEDLKDRMDKWEDDWDQLRDEKRDAERDTRRRKVELGSRRETNDFVEREEELKIRKARLDREIATLGPRLQEYEVMRVQTEAQIEMVKERVDQAEEEAKDAERVYRRR